MTRAAEASVDPLARAALNRLLVLGLLLRVCVRQFASPFNSDDHLGVIDWILAHRALPVSNLLQQSFHPPLYYLLMVPLRAISPEQTWPLHVASCAISCANLVLIRRLFDDPLVVALGASRAFRVVAFALVATLGQLVMFGSFVSNDPLTQLVGTILFASLLRYLRVPTTRGAAALGAIVGVGLLTKGTFLVTAFAIAPIVARAQWSRGGRHAIAVTATMLGLAVAIGCEKYVDNVVRVGRPFVHNQEMAFTSATSRTIWRGPSTIYDVDVTKLIRHPVIRPNAPTSYPLTLYATFWYAHLGDSSFKGNISGYDVVGRATYATAVVPTLLAAIGACGAIASIRRWLRDGEPVAALGIAALALVATNLAVVVAAGVRFDVWEAFQGRLLFQSIAPLATLFLAGAGRVPPSRLVRIPILVACWATAALAVLYFLVEFALAEHLLWIAPSPARDLTGGGG